MQLRWTSRALADLNRLHAFLEPVNARAAARAVQALVSAAAHLPNHPRIGRRVAQYQPLEIRRTLVGQYEMRYEIAGEDVIILRIWNAREFR
jgi:plasmid stabilization system protein ParE